MMERNTEVVIIGGGSTGTSTLYHLAKEGHTDCVLIERGQIASGQTSRSAAIVRTHYSHPTLVKMALNSCKFFRNFENEVRGFKSGFRQTGLIIGANPSSEEGLKENQEMHRSLGVESRIVDVEQLRKIEPELDPSDYSFVVYEPNAGYAEPSTTASSFAAAALELGSTVLTKSEVTSIEKRHGDGYWIQTSGGIIRAEKLLLATGVWFNHFSNMLSLGLTITPVRHVVCMYRRPHEYSGNRPIVFDFAKNAAFKPEGERDLNVSTLETLGGAVDPDAYDASVSFDEISQFSERTSRAFPIMGTKGELSTSYTGLYDNTPDEQPVIDEFSDEGFENMYCCVGLSGHGFKLSPEFGRILSTILTGKKFSDYDISIFRKSRFKEGKLIKSRYQAATIG